MDTRVAAWALVLLLSALVTEAGEVDISFPKRKLCGWEFARALIHACQPKQFLLRYEKGLVDSNGTKSESQTRPPLPSGIEDVLSPLPSEEELKEGLSQLPDNLKDLPYFKIDSYCVTFCHLWDLQSLCY